MFSHLPSKERIAYVGIFALILGGGAFAAFSRGQKPAPIVFDSKPPAVVSPPVKNDELVVQVTGAVNKPGVFHFAPGSRIDDALKAAGGARTDADLAAWNLAAKLVDGSQIYVHTKKEAVVAKRPVTPPRPLGGTIPPVHVEVPAAYRGGPEAPSAYTEQPKTEPASPVPPSHASQAKKDLPAPGSIDLNTATLDDLTKLPGVGPATAQKILDYRQEHGRFASVEELLGVKGIGPKKLDALRDYVRV